MPPLKDSEAKLQKQIEALQAENATLKADLATEQELSKALQEELSKKQVVSVDVAKATAQLPPNAKFDKKEYRWKVISFRLKGSSEPMLAEEANKEPKVLQQLAEMGFGGWEQVK